MEWTRMSKVGRTTWIIVVFFFVTVIDSVQLVFGFLHLRNLCVDNTIEKRCISGNG
uniref:Uncharacterized protein n=1 Tax=Roseihalotalea indica TaxID=2867963 RepID=A0AA49JKH8_9BACT|nr:hypothetical protein K4G66_16530 [Tunicatimonas sp. TK19036]